ncbi:hypothetical protein OTU49_000581 [Cherax quadricarinatus]|uniref:Uncharacterized protein n=1 Tax=Cherax quadricarinatus TaxID=27406 RepID=A0AAW0XXZ6_CHEQU
MKHLSPHYVCDLKNKSESKNCVISQSKIKNIVYIFSSVLCTSEKPQELDGNYIQPVVLRGTIRLHLDFSSYILKMKNTLLNNCIRQTLTHVYYCFQVYFLLLLIMIRQT